MMRLKAACPVTATFLASSKVVMVSTWVRSAPTAKMNTLPVSTSALTSGTSAMRSRQALRLARPPVPKVLGFL